MPIVFKKMQMNVSQIRNARPSSSPAFAGAPAPRHGLNATRGKKSMGLYTLMVNRISGASSGCGCGK